MSKQLKHDDLSPVESNDERGGTDGTRRRFLKSGALASSALLIGNAGLIGGVSANSATTQQVTAQQTSPTLEKWVDPLPRPGVLRPTGHTGGDPYYEVSMSQFSQKLHRDLPETTVWGYEGSFPGPTIEARKGKQIHVKWTNDLPSTHLLPVDTTVHGAEPPAPSVRTVTHLHGGNTPAASDGYPEAWFTNGFEQTGQYFEQEVYTYPNEQPPTTLWYHDHAMGITRLNVYAGLAGFYLIRNPQKEARLNLPKGDYEIPIVLQDRTFEQDGSLFYPDEAINGVQPSIVPEFFGDTSVVNGKAWPSVDVEPRKYRFRLLNGSNARFYNLKLFDYANGSLGTPGPAFHQIGSDGGLLRQPVTIPDRLLLAPAERADIVVDFSGYEGQTLLLHNDAKTPFKSLTQTEDEVPLPEVMVFNVGTKASGHSSIPSNLAEIPQIHESDAVQSRNLTLDESTDDYGRLMLLLNKTRWDEPVTENPQVGTSEVWNLINTTEDTHPIHLHLVQFQILDRIPYNVEQYEADRAANDLKPLSQYYTGSPIQPDSNEEGWNDTVKARPGEVTRIISHFGNYKGHFENHTGRYVWHCHILEHEDHEMMRPYDVVPDQLFPDPLTATRGGADVFSIGPPQDHDGDGLYEDLNGDARLTRDDVTALSKVVSAYQSGSLTLTSDQVDALDFDGDGKLDRGDVRALAQMVQ